MSENTEEMKAHCEVGPSTLPARAVCPCHESAPGGADAQSGTRSHKVVESHIMIWNGTLPVGAGKPPAKPEDYYLPETTDDEIGRGAWGAATIRRLRDETAPGAFVYSETRAIYHGTDASEGSDALRGKFGTVDAHWKSADGGTLYIADYKTYANADSEKSYLPQGMMYAALLSSAELKPFDRATFFVVAGGDRTVARYDFDLKDAIARTAATIRRVDAIRRGVVFASGEEARRKCGKPSAWCKTCAHAATCPAISRAVEIVQGGGILSKPLAVRMAVIPVLESFAKGVRAEVKAALDAGERVYDAASGIEYAYAERRGRARLCDLRGLAESAIAYGVEPGAFAAAVSISKSAVDGLLKAADEREGRKAKKADREAAYARYFTESGMEKYVKRIS